MESDERRPYRFKWTDIGDIAEGRPRLGPTAPVAMFRVMQYCLRDVLTQRYGAQEAAEILVAAGRLAGTEFCRHVLDTSLPLESFLAQLQAKLRELSVGVLRVEKADTERLRFVLTVAEDIDCSGLPLLGDAVCNYDEGFISGILEIYVGKAFTVKEIDCWATGHRICRFTANVRE